jgi:hypothetical protein
LQQSVIIAVKEIEALEIVEEWMKGKVMGEELHQGGGENEHEY